MYSNVFGDKKLSETNFDELLEHYTNKALTGFVEEGGKGLRHAIRNAMGMAIDWRKYCDEDAKKKLTKKSKKKTN